MTIANVPPQDAWTLMEKTPSSCLIDVRTRAEWSLVGLPDLSALGRDLHLIEWKTMPAMAMNANFADELLEKIGTSMPEKVFFLCRSGARSYEAATIASATFAANGQSVECINVAEGFEGDLDSNGHRGVQNGWKARGLTWRQT